MSNIPGTAMTIKRSDLAAWLDRECDKTKAYILSAVVEGKRECGMLRCDNNDDWFVGHFGGARILVRIRGSFEDLPWSDVQVQEMCLQYSHPCLSAALHFTPPPRTITLEVDAEKWEEFRKRYSPDHINNREAYMIVETARRK